MRKEVENKKEIDDEYKNVYAKKRRAEKVRKKQRNREKGRGGWEAKKRLRDEQNFLNIGF